MVIWFCCLIFAAEAISKKCIFFFYRQTPFLCIRCKQLLQLSSDRDPTFLRSWFCYSGSGCYPFTGAQEKTADKLENFESGIESLGNARQPMAIKYFLVAILFVLFDVEVIFFYPYAVNFQDLGWNGFWAVMLFVGFFLCGFIYIIKKGALKWED